VSDDRGGSERRPALVLDGMKVVSFCHYLQGPAGAQYLADMGADVIKVEPIGGAFERHWSGAKTYVDGVSAFYLCANRNKRSIALDLKHPDGKAAALKLIEQADAVMENFRPGVMDRLGLGYEDAKGVNGEVIYASATGFGPDGPMLAKPGQDLLIQAYSGLVASTGHLHERPVPIGFAAADQHGAALLAMSIIGAYVRKLTKGEGTRIDASLLGAGLDLQTEPLTIFMTRRANDEIMRRDRNLATWFHEAPYGVYRLADCWLALSMNEGPKLARALGSAALEEMAEVDRYDDRDRFAATLADALKNRTLESLVRAFDSEKIWYQRVHTYDDLRDDPQIRHNGTFREVDVRGGTAVLVNHPVKYDGETPPLRRLPLEIGQDTREVLGEMGYGKDQIDTLLASGAARAPD
jgi:crotonobetainyl-CoA:carnitine CoA-transferase CaiB-like acyl-CoA transferase